MSKQLQQQVDRLQHEHPIVRRYAVASIFQLLAQHNTYSSKAGHDALQECFKQSSKVGNFLAWCCRANSASIAS